MEELALYNQMVAAIARCVEIDEADFIRTRAGKLEAYARIRDDRETQRKFAELRLRAAQRIGQLSRELETAQGERTDLPVNDDRKLTKEETLDRAGLNDRTARRYEELSGPREQEAMHICAAATDAYFTNLGDDEMPTFDGLKSAVRSALKETFGEPLKRERKAREPDLLVHFLYS